MEEIELQTKLESLPKQIFKAWESYAKERSQFEYLEDYKKPLFSMIRNECGEMSEAKKDSIAYADQRYINHIQAKKVARELSLKAEGYVKTLTLQHESLRSIFSLEKAKANIR